MQFPEGDAQEATDTKSRKYPLKGVEQTCMHRSARLYETTKDDVLDSERHATEDVW